MKTEANSYPLHWPESWPRLKPHERRTARFHSADGRVTTARACDRLWKQLRLLGVRDENSIILSTNLRPNLRGTPDGQKPPQDPAAAVYFRLNGKDRALACDAWDRLPDNIVAIAKHIDAIRSIERYRCGTIDQAFAGYAALPPRGGTWRTMMGFGVEQVVTRRDVQQAYESKAAEYHPDKPTGSHEAMAALNAARAAAFDEVG